MKNHFPFHHLSDLENMMSNILTEGQEDVWQYIEKEKDALKRCAKRKLFMTALSKIKKEK